MRSLSDTLVRYRHIIHPFNLSNPPSLGRNQGLHPQRVACTLLCHDRVPVQPQQGPLCESYDAGFHHQCQRRRGLEHGLPQARGLTTCVQPLLLHSHHLRHDQATNPHPDDEWPDRPRNTSVRRTPPRKYGLELTFFADGTGSPRASNRTPRSTRRSKKS